MVREKAIPGSLGYFVRDDGTVRLLSGRITYGCNDRYKAVGLRIAVKKYITQRVHRLVAAAFVQNPRPDIFNVVDHINGDTHNNHYSNLRWLNDQLNGWNRHADCVTHQPLSKKTRWGIKVGGKYYGGCPARAEALAKAKQIRDQVFDRLYAEALASEPPFKECGTQTDETRLQK
jgi:hypothetical protein